jgi:hypothetical protein
VDDELAAEVTGVVGRSDADQLSAELTDLADVLGLYVTRLHHNGFTKTEAREMAREWYARYLWWDDDECDEE